MKAHELKGPSTRRPTLAQTRSAFTLLELVIVLTLLSVALSSVALQLDGVTVQARLQSAARQLAGVHQLARIEAISSGQPRRVVFGPHTAEIVLQQPRYEAGRWAWSEGRQLHFSVEVALSCDVDDAPGGGGQKAVHIRGDGSSSDYGCVVRDGGMTLTVRIDGRTGRVTIIKNGEDS